MSAPDDGALALRTTGIGEDDVLVVRSTTNPHPADTAAHARHAALRSGQRVREILAGAGDRRVVLAELVVALRAGAVGFVAARDQ